MGNEKLSYSDTNISQNIHGWLQPGERIIWQGKPVAHLFVALSFCGDAAALLAIVVVFFLVVPLVGFPIALHAAELRIPLPIMLGIIILVMILTAVITIGLVNIKFLKESEYVLTNRRIILIYGKGWNSFRIVELDKIMFLDLSIGMLDRRLGTGSIFIGLPGPLIPQIVNQPTTKIYSTKESLFGVNSPFEVQRMILEAIEEYKMAIAQPVAVIDAALKK
ncbi:MAG: PH domain-containing protein [Thermoplasmata archaeon]